MGMQFFFIFAHCPEELGDLSSHLPVAPSMLSGAAWGITEIEHMLHGNAKSVLQGVQAHLICGS
jgi:hypothetical protein